MTTERKTDRAMLALIALSSLPMPDQVTFIPPRRADSHWILSLSFPRIADGAAWAEHLGVEHSVTPWTAVAGRRQRLDARHGRWHGWHVILDAHEDALDEDTVAQLATLAGAAAAG